MMFETAQTLEVMGLFGNALGLVTGNALHGEYLKREYMHRSVIWGYKGADKKKERKMDNEMNIIRYWIYVKM